MAKIAFVQFIAKPMLGVMHLSSALKRKGHKCIMVIGSKKHTIDKLNNEKVDIVGFSESVNGRKSVLEIAKSIKEKVNPKVPIIVGGPWATFSPEIIENPFIDIICRGEGEGAILDLLEAIEKNTDITRIGNLWVKKNGHIFKNEVRPLIEDLDKIEFPDRKLYSDYKFVENDFIFRMITSRGCIYDCTNCFQHSYRQLYRGKCRQFIHKRSVINVINELKLLKKKYKINKIWFIDDIFPIDRDWLTLFADRYREEIRLPFICHIRVNLINDEVAQELKKSTYCQYIAFGLETGKEKYSKDILKRNITNSQIRDGAGILKKYGIKFFTSNMICLPGETIEDALLTLKLNAEIKPNFSVCTIYQPLPMTKLAEFAKENKYFNELDFSAISFFSHGNSLLQQQDIKRLINLHKFFYAGIYFPFLIPLIKLLIKFPNNAIYNLFYNITYFFTYQRKLRGLGFAGSFREAIFTFKYYRDKL